jgi:nitrogen-specific signal transduction histidine kinase/CheY-like chemotaxis protein
MVTWRVVRRLRQSEESLEVSEAQLRQAQKMEAVGQFTGGIAHDFNNLLTVILSTVDLLETQVPAEMPQARSDLADIRRAADRGAGMIRKLLAFSRERQLQFRPHRLHELVQDAGTMLRRVLPEHIELRIDCGLETPAVRTDPAAIEQILLNLGTNARDAMPGGGTLRILTGVADLEPARAAKLGPRVRPGLYATLRVSDTGVGMAPSVLERFFEPFFTTKPPGQGSGLGAAMVYGLVEQHGGAAEVQSAPGEGTTIILYFPLADGQPITVQAPGGDLPRGSETILLVEDEDSVRASTRRLLERQGYGVLEAANGDQGLSIFQAHQSEIALVLSDVVMPRLTGPALHQALRRLGGAVPFLFMSGYTAREIGAEVDLPPGAAFIAKPWTVEDLLVAVRRALDSAGARR